MRFFTEHFFSEEQKAELLGDKYAQARREAMRAEEEDWRRALGMAQTREHLQRQQDEFDRESRLVEMVALPFILAVLLGFGFASSYLLKATI